MSPDFIEMAGQTVGTMQVVDYAKSSNQGAHWVVMCLACKAQQIERGTKIRQAQSGRRVMSCKECGA